MVEADALPPLVQLLSSANIDVAEQAVWAVGNIAGDHPKMRDRVLAQNALPLLCAFLERVAAEGKISPTRNGTWALSNLVRGKPQPQLKDVAPAVPLAAAGADVMIVNFQVALGRTRGLAGRPAICGVTNRAVTRSHLKELRLQVNRRHTILEDSPQHALEAVPPPRAASQSRLASQGWWGE